MSNRVKEIFIAYGFLVASMAILYILGFGGLMLSFAIATLCFVMLRGNVVQVVVGFVLVFATNCILRLSFSFVDGIVICISAMCISAAIKTHAGLLKACMFGVGGVLVGFAISITIAEVFNIEGFRIADLKAVTAQASDVLVSVLSNSEESYALAGIHKSDIEEFVNFAMMGTVPSVLIIVFTGVIYISVMILKKMMGMVKSDFCKEISKFSEIRADKSTALIVVAALGIYMFSKSRVIGAAAFAMLMCLSVFYCVCTLSIGSFYINKKVGEGFSFKKVLLYILLFVGMIVLAPTAMFVGCVDAFADLRRLKGVK